MTDAPRPPAPPSPRTGMSLRFILSSSLIVAIAAGSLTVFFVRTQRDLLRRHLERRTALQARHLAHEALRILERGAPPAAVAAMLREATLDTDVRSVRLLDAAGKDLGAAGRFRDLPTALPDLAPGAPLHDRHVWSQTGDGIPVLELDHPIVGPSSTTPLGVVRVVSSAAEVEEAVVATWRSALLISLVVALASVGLIVLVVRSTVRPLTRLAEAADGIADGDLTTRVTVDATDEVGALAGAFNVMVERLRESREALERAWAAQERTKMGHVVESMLNAVVVVDGDEKVILANRKAREVLALQPDDVATLEQLRLGPRPLAPLVRPVLSGERDEASDRVQFGSPRPQHVHVAVSPMRGVDGDLQGAIAVIGDVTREVEISQQLLQSEKLAAIGQLASGVAHEVNNPLTVISGFAEMLRRQTTTATQRNLVEKILVQAERCSEIVTSLSRFSRKSGGDRVPCDVNRILRETAGLLLSQLRKVNVALVLDLCNRSATVLANASGLQQVVFNLLNNARDAMPEGGTITLRSDILDGQVRFSVHDDGRGIPPDRLTDIFTPFYTTKDPGKGTGLGLAVCQSVVNDLGGRITVDSEVGRGTSFYVYLPRTLEPPARTTRPDSVLTPVLDPPRVLVVDDEADILALCRFLLEELGYEVTALTDTDGARLTARSEPFGLLLFDIRMPGTNGLELLRSLRDGGLRTPALFMTGLLDVELGADGEALEPCGIVRKPFDKTALAVAIRALVERPSTPEAQ